MYKSEEAKAVTDAGNKIANSIQLLAVAVFVLCVSVQCSSVIIST